MKRLAQVFVSACLSLTLVAGVSLTLTGCSADTLSGPDIEAFANDNNGTGGGTSGSSDHNTDKTDGGTGGGTSGSSDHNTDG